MQGKDLELLVQQIKQWFCSHKSDKLIIKSVIGDKTQYFRVLGTESILQSSLLHNGNKYIKVCEFCIGSKDEYNIDPDSCIGSISVCERDRVNILKDSINIKTWTGKKYIISAERKYKNK